jgi:hypothetical protein
MSRTETEHGPSGPRTLTRAQVWLYVVGYAILLAGSLGSAQAYRVGAAYDASHTLATDPIIAKQNEQRMEEIGGKSNVFAQDTKEWFIGLWHGTRLAYTLAVLTLAAAVLCFFTAYFLPEFPAADDSPLESSDLRDRRPGPGPRG